MSLVVDIRKKFHNFTLDVSFAVKDGVSGILGASGSGKSLTLKCIAGIETPDSGRIVLNDRVLYDAARKINLPVQERRVGYLFQNYALFSNMTVEQNIKAGMRRKKQHIDLLETLLNEYQLNRLRNQYPHQLSGGQQQRVALARIIASEPEILLLDEPFSALDSYLKWQISQNLYDTLEQFNGTTLLVSHDRDEMQFLCKQASVLENGKSQPVQEIREMFERPQTVSACLLTGCKNISRIRVLDSHRFEALDWGSVLYSAAPLSEKTTHVGIQPGKAKLSNSGGKNKIQCKLERLLPQSASKNVIVSAKTTVTGHLLQFELDTQALQLPNSDTPLWIEFPQGDILPLCS